MSLPHVDPTPTAHAAGPDAPPSSSMAHTPLVPVVGKHALICGFRATGLVTQLAQRLACEGAHVTLSLRHPQDVVHVIKHLRTPCPGGPGTLEAGSPLDLTSLAAVRAFAAAINSSSSAGQPLHLLVLDTQYLCRAASKDGRWYTPQGLSGAAQTGFLAPAVLLHLLQPTLAACGTAVLLTASPFHRLSRLDNLTTILTSWRNSTFSATQAALLAYTRHLAEQLQAEGVTATTVDIGILSEQPLQGALVRKLPLLHQALHLLLPSAADAAHLLADVAIGMLDAKPQSMQEGATAGATDAGDGETAAAPAGSEQDSSVVLTTPSGSATVSASKQPCVSNATKPFRYLSRGLLASPLVTALDHAGRSSWPSKAMRSTLTPLYQLTASAVLTTTTLADWPVRALLLGPAGLLPALASRLGPLGAWASGKAAQLQSLVPGVVGVPPGAVPHWVEVTPSDAVLDDDLGWRFAALVRCYAELELEQA